MRSAALSNPPKPRARVPSACRWSGPCSSAGHFLADVGVRFGRPVSRASRALAVAVLGPACQHGRGAFRSDGTPVPTATTCTAKVRARSAAHKGAWALAPRAQLAIGGLAGVHVHERRRLLVHGDRELEREVARDLRPCRARRTCGTGTFATLDAERLEALHFVGLGREPGKRRPLNEVIEREQAGAGVRASSRPSPRRWRTSGMPSAR